MPFPTNVKKEALVKSRRSCCICREFAGRNTNVHHIVPESEGGANDLDNAIVLCLRCHGEVGHYNPKHPIGNKYTPEELCRHRDEFWQWIALNPHIPMPKKPISVSPGVIGLVTGKWKNVSLIKVYNASKEIYYQVWIKFSTDTPDIFWSDISIEWLHTDIMLSSQLGGVTVCGDTFQILGTDGQGNKAIYLWLESLNPMETCTFRLRTNRLCGLDTTIHPRILVELWGFEREPTLMLEGANSVALRFRAPETIKINSMAMLLRRDS